MFGPSSARALLQFDRLYAASPAAALLRGGGAADRAAIRQRTQSARHMLPINRSNFENVRLNPSWGEG